MRDPKSIGDVEAAYIHLRVTRDAIRADYAMRRQSPVSVPCPFCSHSGTIHYKCDDGKVVGRCSSERYVSFMRDQRRFSRQQDGYDIPDLVDRRAGSFDWYQ